MSIEQSASRPSGQSSLQSDVTCAPASALGASSGSPQRFVDHGDGTVTDVQTGLMWMRCAEGQEWTGRECIGAPRLFHYDEIPLGNRSFAGHHDWRLPTLEELKSTVDLSRSKPACEPKIFYGLDTASPSFWSSTFCANPSSISNHYYCFVFNAASDINLCNNSTKHYVRFVRNSVFNSSAKTTTQQIIDNPVKQVLNTMPPTADVRSAKVSDSSRDSVQRFVDTGDGTVTDVQTGLMWMRCAEGQKWIGTGCTGAAKEFTYEEARAIGREFAGFGDWRLPTLDELRSIVDQSRNRPTIGADSFCGCENGSQFWTSTIDRGVWQVIFHSGASYAAARNERNRVRLVRKATPLNEHLSKSKSEGLIGISPNVEHPIQSSVQGDVTRLSTSALDTPSASPQRFVDHGDGTVTDVQTGLMWMRCAEGQKWIDNECVGSAKEFTFEAAQAIRREFAGFRIWRLPTLDELKSIVDRSRTRPTIDTDIFYGCDSTGPLFWTSTVDDGVWYVSFYSGNGYATTRNAQYLVRLVRSIAPPKAQISESSSDKPQEDSRHNIERPDINIDYLLRDIERSEQPSPNFINAVFKNPSIVESRGGKFSRTLLHHAAALGKSNIVKHLCSLNLVDVNCADSEGDTPLDYALCSQNSKSIEVVRYLRSKGSKTRMELNGLAARENRHTADKSPHITESHKKALKEALALPHIRGDLANFVLRKPHLINAALFEHGKTMLHFAAEAGTIQIVRWLINRGSDPGALDDFGNVPATSSGTTQVADYLNSLRATDGIEENEAENQSRSLSLLFHEIETLDWPSAKLIKALYDEPQIVNYQDTVQKRTLLHHAAAHGKLRIVEYLCSKCDASNELVDNDGKTPLMLALDYGKGEIVSYIKSRFGYPDLKIDTAGCGSDTDIPELCLQGAVDVIEQTTMRSGDEAFIVYLSITNKGTKQSRIELPYASYVTCHGEEFEQDAWLSGLINGGEGASIRAGNFRKAGLVFYKSKLASISTGDCLHITVLQTKPSQRFNFSFRCTNQASNTFVLVKAELEDLTVQPEPDPVEVFPEKSVILQRLDLLQSGLDEVLRRLERLEASPVAVAPHAPFEQEATTSTRTQVLAWLASQQRVSVAALRHRLLPLDLLPSAFIDEVNERALDFVGEPALEDQNDEVAVIQDVLAVVLAIWEGDSV